MAALQREFAGKGLRFSRGEWTGLPWLCLGLFITFHIKWWEGKRESWLFPPGAWRPREEHKELVVLESSRRGVTFTSTAGRRQRINCAADLPPWESATQAGFCPVTLSLPEFHLALRNPPLPRRSVPAQASAAGWPAELQAHVLL